MKISSKNLEKLINIFNNYHGQNDKVLNCLPQDSEDDIVFVLLDIINNLVKEDNFVHSFNSLNNMIFYIKDEVVNNEEIDKQRLTRKITKILESINTFLREERYDLEKEKEYKSVCYRLSRSLMKIPLEENKNTKYLDVLWTIITEVKSLDYLDRTLEVLNVENTVFKDSHTIMMELVSLYVEKIRNLTWQIEDVRYYNLVIKQILFNKFWNVSEVEREWCIKLLRQEIDFLSRDRNNFVKVDFLNDILQSFNFSFDNSKILSDLSRRYNINLEDSDLSVGECSIDKRFTPRVDAGDYIITIDSSDTKEIDDGVSCEKLEDGSYLLGIHIADIFGYIKIFDQIIDEALTRGETLYLEDLLVYMLPKEFATDKASLLENRARYADSHYFVISKEGEILSDVYMKTIINNCKRTTYDEVNKLLEKNKCGNDLFGKTLENLRDVERILEKKTLKMYRGDNNYSKKNSISNKIVSYIMMLENISMAEYFYENDYPFIYRVCEEHEVDEDIKKIISEEKMSDELDEVLYSISKEKGKVLYGIDGSHSELGFIHYCHSTSPLRRFADLWNRYLITMFRCRNIDDTKKEELALKTENIVNQLNMILDRHEYFNIEYSKKVKQLK